MNGRRAVVGLCMLCALLVSAFAAQSASAAPSTTAVTCKEGPGDTVETTFADAHCKTGPSGSFGHYKINENTTTTLTGRAGSEFSKLKATLGGVATTLTSTSLSGTGSMENKLSGSEHWAEGTGTIVYENVTVTPFEKCFVYTDDGTATPGAKGVVDTVELAATTKGVSGGMGLKFSPKEGTVFARFWILDENKVGAGGNCKIPGTYSVSGSVIATPEGATATTTHAGTTEQNTLKMGTGEPTIKAGIDGSLTIEGKHPGIGGDTFKPLSVTTYTS